MPEKEKPLVRTGPGGDYTRDHHGAGITRWHVACFAAGLSVIVAFAAALITVLN